MSVESLSVLYPDEYRAYCGMKQRCYNPKTVGFHRYGGRGIRVCHEWRRKGGFVLFLGCIGKKPGKGRSFTLGRIDNDGNYEPGNVEWQTMKQQANNKYDNTYLVCNGHKKTLSQWSEYLGCCTTTIKRHLKEVNGNFPRAVVSIFWGFRKHDKQGLKIKSELGL